MKNSLGLRARLVGAVVAVLAVLMAALATAVVIRADQGLTDVQQEQASTAVHQLAESTQYAVLARSELLLRTQLDVFTTTPDLRLVRVLDDGGNVLAQRVMPQPGRLAFVVTVPVRTRALPQGDDVDLLVPPPSAPREVGTIVAEFSDASLTAIQTRMRRDMVVAFVLLGGLGLLGVYLMASRVVRRIARLAGAASQVARGTLDVRVEDAGGDELAGLSQDFNAMTAALRLQRGQLDTAAQALAERESLAAIGRATAVIAHEMRNPLGILLGAAQVAANPQRPEEARQKAARLMEEEVRRLERTLGDLLSYARPKPPEKQRLNAMVVCRHAADRAAMAGSATAALQVDVRGEDAWLTADEQHLSQALLNLLINAAQAGARTVTLNVTSGNPVCIHAVDDGPGVPADLRDQLFRPFVTTKQRGAGLGLAGSRRLMRDNGGELRLLDATPGAHFVVELPGEKNP